MSRASSQPPTHLRALLTPRRALAVSAHHAGRRMNAACALPARCIRVHDPQPAPLALAPAAGWHAEVILSGQLEDRFDVDLHNCLYLVHGTRL